MQAVKDAGILVVLLILATTVRITPVESADRADASLLATPAQAATANKAKALPELAIEAMPFPAGMSDVDARTFVTDEVVQRCAQIVVEFKQDLDHPEQYVVVIEQEEDAKAAPCPRT